MQSILDFFEDIPEPRVERTRRHKLTDILVLALIGSLTGNAGWDEIVAYARHHEALLRGILELPHGVPSADTIRRVITVLDPTALERALTSWAQTLAGSLEGKHIAIDGKTVRHSFAGSAGRGALHLVHAWVCENQMLLGQRATDVKSNEITAIPELLALLNLKKAVVTVDAMGCQTNIANVITEAGGDYVFGLKGNQPTLHEEVLSAFDENTCAELRKNASTFHEEADKGHGRRERRSVYCLRDVDWLTRSMRWPKLATLVLVESERVRGETTSRERRVYISSLKADAARFQTLIREHWHIENKLHWVLDVTFGEDRSRAAKTRGAHPVAVLRRVAMQLLKSVPTPKPTSLAMKKRMANWGFEQLLSSLSAGISQN